MILTSPPYDNLRNYGKGRDFENVWNWEKFTILAKESYRVLKNGGVMVWVVGDATINGSETGSSFKQALYFKEEVGFNIHDTMIFQKHTFSAPSNVRYHQTFEYMFIFSKGKPKTFNPLIDRKNKTSSTWGKIACGRDVDGNILYNKKKQKFKEYGKRFNIWKYKVGNISEKWNKLVKKHPAVFPFALAKDHILSWSNEGDIILDPFFGSGTVGRAAIYTNRKFIGIDISKEYCLLAKKIIENDIKDEEKLKKK